MSVETPAAEILQLTREQMRAARHEILDVYREAFAPPPYSRTEIDVRSFSHTLARHTERQSLRCFVAREGSAGSIVGFAYGYTCAPGQWWHDLVEEALPPGLAGKWLSNAFELVEFAVRPRSQGKGAGKRLHDAILAGLPHRTAVLSTIQADTVALQLYRRRGWMVLLEGFRFPSTTKPYRIMGLQLVEFRKHPGG
jgi:ribosomal protein S18 acetylase RimI-like enzyme